MVTQNDVDWLNNLLSKLASSTNYSTVIDVKDVLNGTTPEIFAATQGNKPSPSGYKSFSEVASTLQGLFPNHTISFVGHTNSMEPLFDYGDALVKIPYSLYKAKFPEPRIGTIFIYNFGNTRIVHRFLGKTKEGFWIFKGDNNFLPDQIVREEQVTEAVVGIFYTNDKITDNQD